MNAAGGVGRISYRVRVAGHLDDHWSEWLGSHRLVRHDDSTTELLLDSVDQAELHGVLSGIRDLGVKLLSLGSVEQPSGVEPSDAPVLDRNADA